jgi:hypothetical protein
MTSRTYLGRFGVRFLVAYFVLYAFPAPLHPAPFTRFIWDAWDWLWNALVGWAAANVFGIPSLSFEDTGNGDRQVAFVRVALVAAVAVIGALAWAARPSTPERGERLLAALRIYLRFVVADALLLYGICKVFPIQFGTIGPHALMATYGETAPEVLLWNFMAASPVYGFIAGALEVIGGLLLLFPRTTLLGALLSFGVMANVVVLNFCYHVGVKLYSLHLLAMITFLILPDAPRLLRAFLPERNPQPTAAGRWRVWGVVLKCIVIFALGLTLVDYVRGAYDSGRIANPPHPFSGVWRVDSEMPTDWEYILIENRTFTIQTQERVRKHHFLEQDGGRLTLRDRPGGTIQSKFNIRATPTHLTLEASGTHLTLTRKTDFPLLSERFSWIDERASE